MTEHATRELRERFTALPSAVRSILVRIAQSSVSDDVGQAQHVQLLEASIAAVDAYFGEEVRIAMGWCLERTDDVPVAQWFAGQPIAGEQDLYHVRHSCEHAVYWNKAETAVVTAGYPCLWCGGASGHAQPPADAHVVDDPVHGLRCYQDPRVRSVPGDEGVGVIHHMADESCCSNDETPMP